MALGGSSGGGGRASQNAVKAGEAWFELNVDDTKVFRTIQRMADKIRGIGGRLQNVGAGVTAIGAGALTPILGLFGAAVEHAAEVDKLSQKLQASAEDVTAYGYAANQSGIETQDFTQAILKLNQASVAAAKDSIDQAVAFEQIGIKAEDFIKLGLEDKLLNIASTFDKLKDPMQQTQFLFALFGEDTNKLLPLFQKGAAGIKELAMEADRLGITLNSEDAKKGREIQQSLGQVWKSLKSTLLEVGFAFFGFTGDIKEGTKIIVEQIGIIREWVKDNKELVVTVAAVLAGVVAAGVAIAGLGTVLSGIVTAVVLVKTVFLALMAAVFSPLGLVLGGITAAIYLLTDGFTNFGKVGQEIQVIFAEVFDSIKSDFGIMFEGIIAAMKAGNMELAFKIMGKGIQLIWADLMKGLREGWNSFIKWLIDWLKNNPWVLPAIGAAIGFAVGGVPGALAGAAAGGAGALAVNELSDEIKNALTADVTDATNRIEQLRKELKALTAEAKAQLAAKGGPAVMPDRPDLRYLEQKKLAGMLGDAVKGTFGSADYKGALGLGPANSIAKKQYEVQKQIRDELIKMNKKVGPSFG
jgi:hypothetical protein